MTFFSVAVMSAVLGAVLILLADRFAAAPADAVVLALAFGLGTPAFAYSNQLYQHQAAAFGAFVGLFVLWRVIEEGRFQEMAVDCGRTLRIRGCERVCAGASFDDCRRLGDSPRAAQS